MKNILRWLSLSFALILFFSNSQVLAKSDHVSVSINNRKKNLAITSVDVNGFPLETRFSPYVDQARTFVPIREITELMGAKVLWNQRTNSVTVQLQSSEVKLKINSNVVYVDGKKKIISNDSIPRLVRYNIKNGETKTMVPLRFLSESFGFNVNWDQKSFKASISNGIVVAPEPIESPSKVEPIKQEILQSDPQIIEVRENNSTTDNPNKVEQVVEVVEKPNIILPEKKSGPLTIVLDPGHGGKDGGASSIDKQKEKDLNLAVAQKLVPMLQSKGYEIIITRNRDEYLTLLERSSIANESKAEIFISIHFNSASSEMAQGIEVLYASEEDVAIKTMEQKHLAKELLNALIKETGAKSRGIKNRPDLSVLRRTEMTAALVELGFLSNKNDMKDINSPGYLDKLARGIFNGVVNYDTKYMK